MNKHHPSLRLHQIDSVHGKVWSISVDKKIRILIRKERQTLIVFDIGSHDQVY
jgi:mRNA-degrading endonuclease YafQ of YafQ-DinJ toxin-antitoxin module